MDPRKLGALAPPRWLGGVLMPLRQLCEHYDVPVGLAVGWIEVESSGNMHEVTTLDERGYFQLSPEESSTLGVIHARLTMDQGVSLEAGMWLIGYHARIVQGMMAAYATKISVVPASEFFWRLVKFSHSIGPGAARTIFADAARAGAVETWETFSDYARANEAHYLHTVKHSPTKWIGLVDRVFEIGAPWGVGLPSSGGPAVV